MAAVLVLETQYRVSWPKIQETQIFIALSDCILWGATFALFKKIVGSSCQKFTMFVRRPGHIPLRHTYTCSSVPGAYTKSPYQDWRDLHLWVENIRVFLKCVEHTRAFSARWIAFPKVWHDVHLCEQNTCRNAKLHCSENQSWRQRYESYTFTWSCLLVNDNGCSYYWKQHFLILVRNPNSRIKLNMLCNKFLCTTEEIPKKDPDTNKTLSERTWTWTGKICIAKCVIHMLLY